MRRRRRPVNLPRLAIAVIGLGLAGIIYGFPLYWLVVTSLKSKG